MKDVQAVPLDSPPPPLSSPLVPLHVVSADFANDVLIGSECADRLSSLFLNRLLDRKTGRNRGRKLIFVDGTFSFNSGLARLKV